MTRDEFRRQLLALLTAVADAEHEEDVAARAILVGENFGAAEILVQEWPAGLVCVVEAE